MGAYLLSFPTRTWVICQIDADNALCAVWRHDLASDLLTTEGNRYFTIAYQMDHVLVGIDRRFSRSIECLRHRYRPQWYHVRWLASSAR